MNNNDKLSTVNNVSSNVSYQKPSLILRGSENSCLKKISTPPLGISSLNKNSEISHHSEKSWEVIERYKEDVKLIMKKLVEFLSGFSHQHLEHFYNQDIKVGSPYTEFTNRIARLIMHDFYFLNWIKSKWIDDPVLSQNVVVIDQFLDPSSVLNRIRMNYVLPTDYNKMVSNPGQIDHLEGAVKVMNDLIVRKRLAREANSLLCDALAISKLLNEKSIIPENYQEILQSGKDISLQREKLEYLERLIQVTEEYYQLLIEEHSSYNNPNNRILRRIDINEIEPAKECKFETYRISRVMV